MRTATTLIMFMAVLLTLLGPMHVAPCMKGGNVEASVMTLDVCNAGGGGTAASGVAVYLAPQNDTFSLVPSFQPMELAESISSPSVFPPGLDHPPQA